MSGGVEKDPEGMVVRFFIVCVIHSGLHSGGLIRVDVVRVFVLHWTGAARAGDELRNYADKNPSDHHEDTRQAASRDTWKNMGYSGSERTVVVKVHE